MIDLSAVSRRSPGNRRGDSFTLIEMLVAMAVLVLLLGIIGFVTQSTSQAIHVASGKLSTYAAARAAFDIMNEKLAQATLNTYMDYYGTSPLQTTPSLNTNSAGFVPLTYGRASNLQFVVKQNTFPATGFNAVNSSSPSFGQEIYFQCPAAYSTDPNYQSEQGLLNACGYYVQYGGNTSVYPSMFTPGKAPKYRYRLMQAIQPTQNLTVLTDSVTVPEDWSWTSSIANTGVAQTPAANAIPIVDNVIALVIWPRLPPGQDPVGTNLAPQYIYDSQANSTPTLSGSTYSQVSSAEQLPPILQVTMVVIDESSAARIDTQSATTPPPQIETALTGKFYDVTKYATDMAAVETSLANNHIEFEVLNTSIVMRESKWSQ